MKTVIFEFLLPVFTYVFYFFFENVVVFIIMVTVAVIAWWKYGISARKSMEIASYVGVVVFVLWFMVEKYWDDDKPSNRKQKSEIKENDVPTFTDLTPPATESKNLEQPPMEKTPEKPKERPFSNPKDNLMAKGIWYDPKTKLYWDRCSVGQTWDGKTCQGEALELTWQDAKDYVKQFTNQHAKGGYTDWRVPTIEELSSIRYCSNGWEMAKDGEESILTEKGRVRVQTIPANDGGKIQVPHWCADGSVEPTINQQIFPNTESYVYWSSSPYASYNSTAWSVVDFSDGFGGYDSNKNSSNYVRAVRSD